MPKAARSFLVSALAAAARGMDAAAFRGRFPNHWILWEPGRWQPPRNATIQATAAQLEAMVSGKDAEALALELAPDEGGEELILGRASECELSINDGTLSSRHLAFRQAGDQWMVRELGSRNGSMVDGVLLPPGAPVVLHPGAKLQAGHVQLTFYAPEGMLARVTEDKAG